jgi:hypothetical protein
MSDVVIGPWDGTLGVLILLSLCHIADISHLDGGAHEVPHVFSLGELVGSQLGTIEFTHF